MNDPHHLRDIPTWEGACLSGYQAFRLFEELWNRIDELEARLSHIKNPDENPSTPVLEGGPASPPSQSGRGRVCDEHPGYAHHIGEAAGRTLDNVPFGVRPAIKTMSSGLLGMDAGSNPAGPTRVTSLEGAASHSRARTGRQPPTHDEPTTSVMRVMEDIDVCCPYFIEDGTEDGKCALTGDSCSVLYCPLNEEEDKEVEE